jgi:predicted RNA-binding Zn ribbon-like protein
VNFTGYSVVMTEWTAHRFSGGVLALDLANTVVWKDDALKRLDRLQSLSDIEAFASAAAQFSDCKTKVTKFSTPKTKPEKQRLTSLRNAVDDWLRPIALGRDSGKAASRLLKAAWQATQHAAPDDLEYACALSAIQFFQPQKQAHVKVCPACRWLFLDSSKNKSRRWCDMKVCGNRAKARAHYELRKLDNAEVTP